jgi:hypothetical protein
MPERGEHGRFGKGNTIGFKTNPIAKRIAQRRKLIFSSIDTKQLQTLYDKTIKMALRDDLPSKEQRAWADLVYKLCGVYAPKELTIESQSGQEINVTHADLTLSVYEAIKQASAGKLSEAERKAIAAKAILEHVPDNDEE